MNFFITISLFLSIITLKANELEWVDEQINAIKPPREGLSNSFLVLLDDPFIFFTKSDDKKVGTTKGTNKKIVIYKPVKKKKRFHKKKRKHKKIKQKIYYKSRYLTLNAIMNKSVLINNRWYKIGDKVSKFTIKSISRTSVVLISKNIKLILSTKSNFKTLNFKK